MPPCPSASRYQVQSKGSTGSFMTCLREGQTASLQEAKMGEKGITYSSQTGHERLCNLLSLWTLCDFCFW